VSESLFLQRAARADLESAYNWYESREYLLGERFLASVELAFKRIMRNPEIFPLRIDSMRRVQVDTFSYGIFYSIDSSKIIVHAIFHTARNPDILKSRFPRNLL
jgi:plasmid stabilization system protein ParE